MILTVDMTSDVPLYQQIRDRIVQAIAAGHLAEGHPLPPTRQLAIDLGINFHTVHKAYDLLRREGFLRLNRKSGAVVQRDASSGPPETTFTEDWQARLRVVLAEAVANGVADWDVLETCRSVLAQFDQQRLGQEQEAES